MYVCRNNHSEICYDSDDLESCPLCDAVGNQLAVIGFKDLLEDENQLLEKKVEKLQCENSQFQTLIADLENTIDRMGVEE